MPKTPTSMSHLLIADFKNSVHLRIFTSLVINSLPLKSSFQIPRVVPMFSTPKVGPLSLGIRLKKPRRLYGFTQGLHWVHTGEPFTGTTFKVIPSLILKTPRPPQEYIIPRRFGISPREYLTFGGMRCFIFCAAGLQPYKPWVLSRKDLPYASAKLSSQKSLP